MSIVQTDHYVNL